MSLAHLYFHRPTKQYQTKQLQLFMDSPEHLTCLLWCPWQAAFMKCLPESFNIISILVKSDLHHFPVQNFSDIIMIRQNIHVYKIHTKSMKENMPIVKTILVALLKLFFLLMTNFPPFFQIKNSLYYFHNQILRIFILKNNN